MKKLCLAAAIFVFLCGAARAESATARYYIPPSQFNAALQVMDLGFANVLALFRNATGSFEFDEANKTVENLRLAIDAAGIMANNSENTSDLMVLLGTNQYREISFISKEKANFKDGKAEIRGTLNLHGMSKPFTLDATLNQMGKSPKAGGMWSSEGQAIGLSLRGTIKRADFGMVDEPDMRSRFGETITLQMETQAIRQ
ncbi:MAG: YceI family protein [Bdellovibrionales bacterium]